jgi:hypothetical protein
MLSIKDIGQGIAQLKNSNLTQTKLWPKPTNQVKPLDLLIYHKSEKMQGNGARATEELDVLIGETVKAMLDGRVNDAPYVAYMNERPTMTLGDFTDALYFSELSLSRRKALLFALETNTKPEDVVALTWNKALRLKFSPLAMAILNTQPRHIRLNYVFWEEIDTFGMAGPLFGLSQNLQETFEGLSFHQVKKLYDAAPQVDPFIEGEEFKEQILLL